MTKEIIHKTGTAVPKKETQKRWVQPRLSFELLDGMEFIPSIKEYMLVRALEEESRQLAEELEKRWPKEAPESYVPPEPDGFWPPDESEKSTGITALIKTIKNIVAGGR